MSREIFLEINERSQKDDVCSRRILLENIRNFINVHFGDHSRSSADRLWPLATGDHALDKRAVSGGGSWTDWRLHGQNRDFVTHKIMKGACRITCFAARVLLVAAGIAGLIFIIYNSIYRRMSVHHVNGTILTTDSGMSPAWHLVPVIALDENWITHINRYLMTIKKELVYDPLKPPTWHLSFLRNLFPRKTA